MGICRTLLALFLSGAALAQQPAPYTVADGVFNRAQPDFGLRRAPGTQTITVFAPDAKSDEFSNGVVLIPFQGRLYAQWQSGRAITTPGACCGATIYMSAMPPTRKSCS